MVEDIRIVQRPRMFPDLQGARHRVGRAFHRNPSGYTTRAARETALPEMNERYIRWWTPHLSRDLEMLVFGDGAGIPVVLFQPLSADTIRKSKVVRARME